MNISITGLFVGLLLGIAAAAGGFSGFLIALVLGVIGFGIGAQISGTFDFRELVNRNRG